jgi:hypothetical protein
MRPLGTIQHAEDFAEFFFARWPCRDVLAGREAERRAAFFETFAGGASATGKELPGTGLELAGAGAGTGVTGGAFEGMAPAVAVPVCAGSVAGVGAGATTGGVAGIGVDGGLDSLRLAECGCGKNRQKYSR